MKENDYIIERRLDGETMVVFPRKKRFLEKIEWRLKGVFCPTGLMFEAMERDTYDREKVLYALKKGAQVDALDPKTDQTILMVATRHNDFDMVLRVVSMGATINRYNRRNQSAVMMAANDERRLGIMNFLLEASYEQADSNALIYAALNNNNRAIDLLLRHKAYPAPEALFYCVNNGNAEGCELLLKEGASVKRSDPESYFDIAAKKGFTHVLKALIPYEKNTSVLKRAMAVAKKHHNVYCRRDLLRQIISLKKQQMVLTTLSESDMNPKRVCVHDTPSLKTVSIQNTR